jgi:hypothetical protein
LPAIRLRYSSGGTGRTITDSVSRLDNENGRRLNAMGIQIRSLGLLVDATEPRQREKHERILNHLGREGWEAVAYAAQSDTVLLKRPIEVNSLDRP